MSVRGVDQQCRISSVAEKCCSEVSVGSVAQQCGSEVLTRSVDQKCRSEVLLTSVDEQCGSEALLPQRCCAEATVVLKYRSGVRIRSIDQVLLRTVDRGVGQRCRSAVSNQQCCSEVCVRSVAQKYRSEVSIRSVARNCRAEVSV